MTGHASHAIDLGTRLGHLLDEWREPGAAELCALLQELLNGDGSADGPMRLEQLKQEVYRLHLGGASGRRLVLKRLKPAIAHADRLVAERWLPMLGLGDRCPRLLGAAAQRAGTWVWHTYEDLGQESLAHQREPRRLAAAVDLLAELHTRAAGHALLPEVRGHAHDYGAHFFTTNLRDAIAALQALTSPPGNVPREFAAAREGLLHGLCALREDAPRRVGALEGAGGPETLLHGDLWPKNVFVTLAGDRPRARLIDWDHVGVGPFSYDVSTFLYQSSPQERPEILRRYRAGVERAGWRLPDDEELDLLFHTAECARYAHCIVWAAMALLNDGAQWAVSELLDWQRWLEALRPPLSGRRLP